MYYTGIDLHKKTSFLTTVDENGKTVSKKNIVTELGSDLSKLLQ